MPCESFSQRTEQHVGSLLRQLRPVLGKPRDGVRVMEAYAAALIAELAKHVSNMVELYKAAATIGG